MSDFRKLAHLVKQLGDERFAALISSDNTGKVKEFCDACIKDALPATMTIGGRTYDILGFLREDEKSVVGHTMVERVQGMNANLDKDDAEHILRCQADIPVALRGKVVFVFTDWRPSDDPEGVYFVFWSATRWVRCWDWLDYDFRECCRVLRRKST